MGDKFFHTYFLCVMICLKEKVSPKIYGIIVEI